jgi:hypothetical protein
LILPTEQEEGAASRGATQEEKQKLERALQQLGELGPFQLVVREILSLMAEKETFVTVGLHSLSSEELADIHQMRSRHPTFPTTKFPGYRACIARLRDRRGHVVMAHIESGTRDGLVYADETLSHIVCAYTMPSGADFRRRNATRRHE